MAHRNLFCTAVALASIALVACTASGAGGHKTGSESRVFTAVATPTTSPDGTASSTHHASTAPARPASSGAKAGQSGHTSDSASAPKPAAVPPATSVKAVEVPSGSKRDTCKITGAAAVERAFGGAVLTERGSISGTGSTLCSFFLHGGAVGSLTVQMSLTKQETRAAFAQVKRQNGNQSVSGIGDDAFYTPSSRTIHVMVSNAAFVVTALPASKTLTSTQTSKLRSAQVSIGKVIAAQQ